MVSWCANPDCRRELRYFREGKIYAFLMSSASGHRRLEHFWLCGECFKTMSLVCANHREVKILHRPASPPVEPASIENVPIEGTIDRIPVQAPCQP